jgi:putative phage-type endonuclease
MDRTKGIGGTDIAAIIGLNPWKSAIDVYMEKLGLTEPQEDNEAMWWGREMEPVLQKRYIKETRLDVFRPIPLIHPDYPWYIGSPDAVYSGCPTISTPYTKYEGGVDYKTTGYSHLSDWGEPGTDEVPPYYHTQAMWYMGLTGANWWDIACLFMGARREFKIYRVNRDDDLIAMLIEKGKDFWENNILSEVPPTVDASPGWKKFFNTKWPKEEEDIVELIPDNDDIHKLIAGYRSTKTALADFQKMADESENEIKMIIGKHAGLKGQFGKITWKKSKDRVVTDWEKAFNDIWSGHFGDINKADYLKQFTVIKPGPRIFRTTWNKEKDNE